MPKFFNLAFGSASHKASASTFKDDVLGHHDDDREDWAQCSLEHRRGARVKSYAVNIGASTRLKKAIYGTSPSRKCTPNTSQGRDGFYSAETSMDFTDFAGGPSVTFSDCDSHKAGFLDQNQNIANAKEALFEKQKASLNRSARRFPALHEAHLDQARRRKQKRQAAQEDLQTMLQVSQACVKNEPRRQGMCNGFDHSTCRTYRTGGDLMPSKLNDLTASAQSRNAKMTVPKPLYDGPPFVPTHSGSQAILRRPVMFDTPYFDGRLPPGHHLANGHKASKIEKDVPCRLSDKIQILEQTVGSNDDGEDGVTVMPGRISEARSNRRSDKRHTIFALQELRKSALEHTRGSRVSRAGEDDDSDGDTSCSDGVNQQPRPSTNASTALWSLSLKSTVKQRVSRLKHARRLFADFGSTVGGEGVGPGRPSQRAKLFLPESDVKSLKQVWNMYDADGSGDLDTKECAEILADLGLKPKTRDEKIELAEIMEETTSTGNGDVDFAQLCAIVQRLRAKVQESHTKNLFTVFQQHDSDDSNALDRDEVMQILPQLKLQPVAPEEEQAICDLMAEVDADGSGELEFPEFVTLVTKVTEKIQVLRRQREVDLKEEFNLDAETFRHYRPEILKMKRIFDSYDKDGSGTLDLEEIRDFIAEVGLWPRGKQDQQEVDTMCEEFEVICDGSFNFKQVLLLIQKVRRKNMEDHRAEMRALFMSYDKDRSGELSFGEVSKVLQDVGLTPSSREQQEEMARMMEEADEDGSMELTFEEFLSLSQRIAEKLKAMQREYEKQEAMDLKFTEAQLGELRHAFDVLDNDGSGSLEVSEARRALQLMGKRITSDRLRELMFQITGYDCAELDFVGFLNLVRLLEGQPSDQGKADANDTPSQSFDDGFQKSRRQAKK